MTTLMTTEVFAPLTLTVRTAEELMTPNPVSIRAEATIPKALAVLIDKGFSAAPVMDEAGRPIGVVSRSDFLAHDREKTEYPAQFSDGMTGGLTATAEDKTPVREIMTPVVFSVAVDTPAAQVVSEMVGLHVHRLFVVDRDGVLVGVISSLDILEKLH